MHHRSTTFFMCVQECTQHGRAPSDSACMYTACWIKEGGTKSLAFYCFSLRKDWLQQPSITKPHALPAIKHASCSAHTTGTLQQWHSGVATESTPVLGLSFSSQTSGPRWKYVCQPAQLPVGCCARLAFIVLADLPRPGMHAHRVQACAQHHGDELKARRRAGDRWPAEGGWVGLSMNVHDHD